MNSAIVSDTGPLIALARIKLLSLLPQLFTLVYVPGAVVIEATRDLSRPGAKAVEEALVNDWLTRVDVSLTAEDQTLSQLLDRGETESLVLAEQTHVAVLLDERRARQVAIARGIAVTGTAALLLKAKQKKLIRVVKPLLTELTAVGYRLSPALITYILNLADE